MMLDKRNRWFSRFGILSAAAVGGLAVLTLPLSPAKTQYLGLDFGNGVGIGVGTPPSAYGYYAYGYPPYHHDYYGRPLYYRPYYPW